MASPIGGAFIKVAPVFPGFQSKAKAEAGKLEKTFDRSGASSGRSFASALGKTVKTGAAVVGTAAAAGLGYALKKGFDRLVDIENATASLKGLGHSAQSVQQIMDNALAAVKGTAFGMGEAAQVAASAVASGVKPGQELERTLRLVGDAATIGQVSMGEMGQIFNKVAAKGKMQAQEANMLLERGIPIWEMLSKSMGLSVEEVQKLSTQGKIGFAEFQTAMEKGLGGAALKVGNTTTGALRNTGAAASRLGATLLSGAFPQIKPLFISIIGVIDRLTDAAVPLGQALGKVLAPAIATLTKWLDGLRFDSFQAFLTSAAPKLGAVSSKAGGLNSILSAIAPTGRALGTVFNVVGSVLGFLGRHMGFVVKLLPLVLAGFIAWRVATFALNNATERLRWAEVAMAPVYLANNALRLTNILLERQGAAAKQRAALATAQQTAATTTNTAALGGNRVAVMLSAAATKWHSAVTGGLIRKFAVQKLSVLGSATALAAHKLAMVSSTVATKGAALATRGLNLALKAGPWMLVIGAIAAIAFGLQQFFTKTDEGRALWAQFTADMSAALAPLKAEFARLQPVISEMMGTFSQIGAELMGSFSQALSQIVPPIMTLVSTLAAQLVPVISTLVSSIIPVFATLLGVVATVVTSVVRALVPLVTALISVLVPVLRVVLGVVAGVVRVLAAVLVPVVRAVGVAMEWLANTVFKPAWEGIKIAAAAVQQWFVGTLAPAMGTATNQLGAVFSWLYTSVVQPVWSWIQQAIAVAGVAIRAVMSGVSWFVQTILAPAFHFLSGVVSVVWQLIRVSIQLAWGVIQIIFAAVNAFIRTVLAPVFQWLYNSVVKPIFSLIGLAISIWWTGAKIIFAAVNAFIRTVLAPVFQWLYNSVVKPIFNLIGLAISIWWTGAKIIFNAVISFIRFSLVTTFVFLRDRVTQIWNGIKTVISTGWNFIRDHVFAPLENAIKNTVPAAFRAGKDAISKAWDKVRDAAKTPVKFVIERVVNDGVIGGFNRIASKFGVKEIDKVKLPAGFDRGGWTGPGPRLMPAGVVHADEFVVKKPSRRRLERRHPGLLDHINRTGELPMYGSYAGGGMVWNNLWGIVKQQFKGVRLHSAYRPGSITSSGNRSYHARGMAIDITPDMKIFNWLHENFGQSRELIFSPANGRQIKNGRHHMYGGAVRRQHFNHIHWANDRAFGGPTAGASGEGGGGGGTADPGFFTGPFEALKKKVASLVKGSGGFADMMRTASSKVIDWPITWINDNIGKVAEFVSDAWNGVKERVVNGTARAQGSAWAMANGISGNLWRAVDYIISHESSWNPKAKNPRSSAAGLPQFIVANQKHYGVYPIRQKSVWAQLDAFMKYVTDRFGGLLQAESFWRKHHYYDGGGRVDPVLYDQGGWLPPGLSTVLNATGKPEPVFSPEQWAKLDAAGAGGARINIEQLVAFDADDAVAKLHQADHEQRAHYGAGVLV